jgi:hypothetical protein
MRRMRIGVDFDNTIACYDGVFHAIALERGVIPASLATDKTSVRDYLRARGQDPIFTELQGYVYGPGMQQVSLYPDVAQVLRGFVAAGHELCLISHKSRTPFAGPAHDLHDWAWRFLVMQRLVEAPDAPFRSTDVYFELTLDAKLARIADRNCGFFVDDLPEVLASPAFPMATRGVLFDPEGNYPEGRWQDRRFERCTDWASISNLVG